MPEPRGRYHAEHPRARRGRAATWRPTGELQHWSQARQPWPWRDRFPQASPTPGLGLLGSCPVPQFPCTCKGNSSPPGLDAMVPHWPLALGHLQAPAGNPAGGECSAANPAGPHCPGLWAGACPRALAGLGETQGSEVKPPQHLYLSGPSSSAELEISQSPKSPHGRPRGREERAQTRHSQELGKAVMMLYLDAPQEPPRASPRAGGGKATLSTEPGPRQDCREPGGGGRPHTHPWRQAPGSRRWSRERSPPGLCQGRDLGPSPGALPCSQAPAPGWGSRSRNRNRSSTWGRERQR